MGKVTYSPGIEYVNGALAKAKKKEGHRCGDYLIGTHRTAPTTNPDCTRLYIRKGATYERTTLPSQDELDARARFAAVSRAVATRKQNLATIAADQAAFVAQKDQPGGKKTFVSYLWSVCGAAYDQQNP
jgi:hypothetical protein